MEAVRRDNICKTQCSFALNSDPPTEGVLTAPPPPAPPRAPLPPRAPARPLPPNRLPLPPNPPRPPLRQSAPFFGSPPSGPRTVGQPLPSQAIPPIANGVSQPNLPPPLSNSPPINGIPLGAGVPLGGSGVLPPGGGNIPANLGQSNIPTGNNRQPRPLFTFPSLRLPNLSDIFGI